MDVGCNLDYKNYSRHDDHVEVDETQHGPRKCDLTFQTLELLLKKVFIKNIEQLLRKMNMNFSFGLG